LRARLSAGLCRQPMDRHRTVKPHQHGKYWAYCAGCRCDECRHAEREYREGHRAERRLVSKRYVEKHPERRKATMKKYRAYAERPGTEIHRKKLERTNEWRSKHGREQLNSDRRELRLLDLPSDVREMKRVVLEFKARVRSINKTGTHGICGACGVMFERNLHRQKVKYCEMCSRTLWRKSEKSAQAKYRRRTSA
jgi:hypothetical protein